MYMLNKADPLQCWRSLRPPLRKKCLGAARGGGGHQCTRRSVFGRAGRKRRIGSAVETLTAVETTFCQKRNKLYRVCSLTEIIKSILSLQWEACVS